MKTLSIILTLLLPMTGLGYYGWSFADYSLLAGQHYRFGQRPLWNFEIQLDRFSKSCTRLSPYCGIGLNYSFNANQTEFGLKGMINPTRILLVCSRSVKFYPYLFGQGNFQQTKNVNPIAGENNNLSTFSFRPGAGISGNLREYKDLSFRPSLQVGYTIPFGTSQSFKNALTVEFKIGIGIASGMLKRKKRMEEEMKKEEAG